MGNRKSKYELAYGKSNGRVANDITLPWMVKVVIPIH